MVSNSSLGLKLARSLAHPFPGYPQLASLFTTFTYTFTATSTSSTLILSDDPTNFTYSADGVLDNVKVIRIIPPPVLVLPKNITEEAESAAGTEVEFEAKATASVAGKVTLTYSKASDSVFPIGVTTVTVTAIDAAGNKTIGTFTVTITPKPVKVVGSNDDNKSTSIPATTPPKKTGDN